MRTVNASRMSLEKRLWTPTLITWLFNVSKSQPCRAILKCNVIWGFSAKIQRVHVVLKSICHKQLGLILSFCQRYFEVCSGWVKSLICTAKPAWLGHLEACRNHGQTLTLSTLSGAALAFVGRSRMEWEMIVVLHSSDVCVCLKVGIRFACNTDYCGSISLRF